MKRLFTLFRKKTFLVLLAAIMLTLWYNYAAAKTISTPGESKETEDKTLSPYFFVKSDDPKLDQLPLKSTSASVNVSGVIADVTVVQVYKNEGQKALEAVYVFPASTRAAVHGMKMTVGERTITAKIEKREEARQEYEHALHEGKSASLLEQQRPNVFQMNVANILPGDEIRTELHYTEILVPTDSIYEFVYPTVVGPRYSNLAASGAPSSEKWTQNPYLHEGASPTYVFDMKAALDAGVPIQEMTCPSHKVNIQYRDKTNATVELDPSEKLAGNRDFILKYRLSGEHVESGLLLFEGPKENFFLLTMQPPVRVTDNEVPPREYIFIMDVSGSMDGYPIDISKKLMKDLVSGLRPVDRFDLLLFAGDSQLLSEKTLSATPENIQRAVALIERQQAGGGTELLPAMQRALGLPRAEGMSRTLIIATDGYVGVEPQIFDTIRDRIGDANFFTFGIGTAVNRHLIEGMAHVGTGESFVITKPEEAPFMAEKFRQYVLHPVLVKAKMDFGKFETYDVEPAGVPDLFAERPVVIFGKWKGKPQGTITLSGLSAKQKYEQTIDVSRIKPLGENSALQYLWARSRITQLGDYNNIALSDERVARITELGLNYNLLTAYTSFVAIDTEIRRKEGDVTTVKQPLPLPEGVGDLAVGGEAMTMGAQVGSGASYPRMRAKSIHGGSSNAPALAAMPDVAMRGSGGMLAYDPPSPSSPKMDMEGGVTSAKPVPAAAKVSVPAITVKGDLALEVARAFLEQHANDLLACLSKPGQSLELKWTVDPDGSVKSIQITSSGGTQALKKCLGAQLGQWVFPVPKNGQKVQVTATFMRVG